MTEKTNEYKTDIMRLLFLIMKRKAKNSNFATSLELDGFFFMDKKPVKDFPKEYQERYDEIMSETNAKLDELMVDIVEKELGMTGFDTTIQIFDGY